jgi:hypothetical protein
LRDDFYKTLPHSNLILYLMLWALNPILSDGEIEFLRRDLLNVTEID